MTTSVRLFALKLVTLFLFSFLTLLPEFANAVVCDGCLNKIEPVLGCISKNDDGTYTASWGYYSHNSECCGAAWVSTTSSFSPFTPTPDPRVGLAFYPGYHPDVFTTTWDGTVDLTWTIHTPISWTSYADFSATAKASDVWKNCPEEPPTCDAGTAIVKECSGVDTTITLDGSKSKDLTGAPLAAYSWDITCNEPVTVIGADTATPSFTLKSPGLGTEATCTAKLTIMDAQEDFASCQTTVRVPACTIDCLGVPNGTATKDICGKCNGDGKSCLDCEGTPFGTKVYDACGKCGGDNTTCRDCSGTINGTSKFDICGVCDGDGTSCLDCNGKPNGGAVKDICGVCEGDGKGCLDCKGVPFGSAKPDRCGVCEGDGQSCLGCVIKSNDKFIAMLIERAAELLNLNIQYIKKISHYEIILRKKYKDEARKLYKVLLQLISALPKEVLDCSNTSLCVKSEGDVQTMTYYENTITQLVKLSEKIKTTVLNQGTGKKCEGSRKECLKRLRQRIRDRRIWKQKIIQLSTESIAVVKNVPTTESICK